MSVGVELDVGVGVGVIATVMEALVPVIELFTVSVAEMVCEPAVFKVTENVPTPFVKVELEGKAAWVSVDAK